MLSESCHLSQLPIRQALTISQVGRLEVWRGPVIYLRSPNWWSQDLSPGPSLKAKFFLLPVPLSEPSWAAELSSEAPVSGFTNAWCFLWSSLEVGNTCPLSGRFQKCSTKTDVAF